MRELRGGIAERLELLIGRRHAGDDVVAVVSGRAGGWVQGDRSVGCGDFHYFRGWIIERILRGLRECHPNMFRSRPREYTPCQRPLSAPRPSWNMLGLAHPSEGATRRKCESHLALQKFGRCFQD